MSHIEEDAQPPTKAGRPAKIVICDDEQAILRLLQANLESQGYEVISAKDGRDCLAKLREMTPDLVILDVMMPYIDGLEVLKFLRRHPETEHLPVVMLTSKSQDEDLLAGYRTGADFYLTKPFNPMELLTVVNRLLAAS